MKAPWLRADRLKDLSRTVLGDVQWSPPAWPRRVAEAVLQFAGFVRAHPRHSAGVAGAVVAVVLASVLGWRWYESRPKPVEYSVSVSAPERTCIECDPPGSPNPAVLTFSGSVAPLESVDKVVDPAEAGISIRPAIDGEWRWQDDQTLVFTPAGEWPLGRTYEVQFARRGFAAPQVGS